MNKTLYLISLIVVLPLTSCQSSLMADHTPARNIQLEIHTAVKAMQLPDDIVVPVTLPTSIQDPTLLEGWIRLNNRRQKCELWGGYFITSQMLAQHVIDHAVVIAWNTSTIFPDSWVDRDNTGTIYINPAFQEKTATQMDYLVSEIAHEIYHDLTPFNQKADTLYEEYWAFYVGACVSGLSTVTIKLYNPLSSASLTQWFIISRHSSYLDKYDMYPENVVAISLP